MANQDARDELRRRTHEALQGMRGRNPTEPPVEPIAQAAWAVETNGGRRHPLDVVISGSLHHPLKLRGFKRRGRTWNRRLGGLVHVINLQASKFKVEQDRTLEQQGEEMSRLILDVGVAYLDRFTSLEAFYAIARDEASRDPPSANKWAPAYAGIRTGDRAGAEIEFRRMVDSMWTDTTWRPKVERMALALELPLSAPAVSSAA